MKSVLGIQSRKPDISFYREKGTIDITAAIVDALGIEEGDSIDIIADDFECALTVRPHATGGRYVAQCRPTTPKSKNMRAYCRQLTEFICDRFHSDVVKLATASRVREVDGVPALALINRNLYNGN